MDKNIATNISLQYNEKVVVNPQKISNIFNWTFLETVDKIASRKVQSTADCNNTIS
jgi:hypothetical protein